jgi:hypothetical protein
MRFKKISGCGLGNYLLNLFRKYFDLFPFSNKNSIEDPGSISTIITLMNNKYSFVHFVYLITKGK